MNETPNRLVNPEPRPDDRFDPALRPKTLAELIGQDQVKENLRARLSWPSPWRTK